MLKRYKAFAISFGTLFRCNDKKLTRNFKNFILVGNQLFKMKFPSEVPFLKDNELQSHPSPYEIVYRANT